MDATTIKDYEEIYAALKQYADGINISGEETSKAFHDNAIMNGGPIQILYNIVDQAGKGEGAAHIDILDVAGNVACARVTLENLHGKNYIDFMQLIKTEKDGWKIISKVYSAC